MRMRQALVSLGAFLPLPVTAEHLIRPLLLRLPARPEVALALMLVGSALGSCAASTHLVPPLLAVLTSHSPDQPGKS